MHDSGCAGETVRERNELKRQLTVSTPLPPPFLKSEQSGHPTLMYLNKTGIYYICIVQ